jgi:RNA-binding protein
MSTELTSSQVRKLKSIAQRLPASIKVGKQGVTVPFLKSLDDALVHHELVKVKFDDLKERKKELAPILADKTSSHLVTMIGNVVVLYRKNPELNRIEI